MRKLTDKQKPKEGKTRDSGSYSLYGQPAFYALYNLDDNEKNRVKFIKTVESMVRTSHEYSGFLAYLKQEAKLTYCSIMNGLEEGDLKDITLEIHHYPYTLFDITEAVLNRALMNQHKFTRLSLANEVMNLHYSLKVGLVPLTLTMHQMAHSGNILVDLDHVFGDYRKFSSEYDLYLSEDAKGRYTHYFQRTKNKELIRQFNADKLSFNPKLFLLQNDGESENEGEEIEEDF